MIPALLAQIGVPVLTNILSEVLGEIDTPVTKGAAKALKDVDQAMKQGDISHEQMAEANRHAEKMAQMRMEAQALNLSEINQSVRAEVASQDIYVRRMRPTFGYLMAFTWAAQMFGVAYVIVFETERSGEVLNAMNSLSRPFGQWACLFLVSMFTSVAKKRNGLWKSRNKLRMILLLKFFIVFKRNNHEPENSNHSSPR